METFKIDGVAYPIKFGNAALANYRDIVGNKEAVDFKETFILIWCGMKQGARIEKKDFDFESWEEVADLLDGEQKILEELIELAGRSMGGNKSEGKSKRGRAKK